MISRRQGKMLAWAIGVGIFFLLPALLEGYPLFLINMLAVYALVSIGLNLLMGYTGQIAAGHAGFLALGAYFTAILNLRIEWLPFIVVLVLAGLFTGAIGFLLGIPILRLRGFYIAMATLAFGVVVSEIILQWSSLTNGDDGLQVPTGRLGGLLFDSDVKLYFMIVSTTIIMTLLAMNLVKSRVGRAFVAIRESEIAAQTMGINMAKYKTIAFAVSAFYTGVAGGLFAYLITYISPDSFDIELSIDFIAMIVIGGMGSIWGSVVGAVILTGMQQLLAGLKDLQVLIFGLSLIVFMIFMPRGIAGIFSSLKERVLVKKAIAARGRSW